MRRVGPDFRHRRYRGRQRFAFRAIAFGQWRSGGKTMKAMKTKSTHHTHHIGYEGSHVMLPLVVLSLMAVAVYCAVRLIDISELGRSALFDVVMLFVALGVAGLFGVVGAWLRSNGDDAREGFCFVGALIGGIVFYVALLTN
jgi:hypothetical protein